MDGIKGGSPRDDGKRIQQDRDTGSLPVDGGGSKDVSLEKKQPSFLRAQDVGDMNQAVPSSTDLGKRKFDAVVPEGADENNPSPKKQKLEGDDGVSGLSDPIDSMDLEEVADVASDPMALEDLWDPATLQEMPKEVLDLIGGNLSDRDLGALSSTSKKMSDVFREDMLFRKNKSNVRAERVNMLRQRLLECPPFLKAGGSPRFFNTFAFELSRCSASLLNYMFTSSEEKAFQDVFFRVFDKPKPGTVYVECPREMIARTDCSNVDTFWRKLLSSGPFVDAGEDFLTFIRELDDYARHTNLTSRSYRAYDILIGALSLKIQLSMEMQKGSDISGEVFDLFESEDPQKRIAAASLAVDIIRSGVRPEIDKALVLELKGLLKDENAFVRGTSANLVGEVIRLDMLPDTHEDLVLGLNNLMEDSEPFVRQAFVDAVGGIIVSGKMPESHQALLDQLSGQIKPGMTSEVATAMADTIGAIIASGQMPESHHVLLDQLKALESIGYYMMDSVGVAIVDAVGAIIRSGVMPESNQDCLDYLMDLAKKNEYVGAAVIRSIGGIIKSGVMPESNQHLLDCIKGLGSEKGNILIKVSLAYVIEEIIASKVMADDHESLWSDFESLIYSLKGFRDKSRLFILLKNLAGEAYFDLNIGDRKDFNLSEEEIRDCLKFIRLERFFGVDVQKEVARGNQNAIISSLKDIKDLIVIKYPEPGPERTRLVGEYMDFLESIVNDGSLPESLSDVAFKVLEELSHLP